eukprot:Hpha_TRINITY_DN15555_c0_g9::TRINITY_DN15555_c0_g9_i1::g.108858::m.108858
MHYNHQITNERGMGLAVVLGVAAMGHLYLEPLMGWGCHDNAYTGNPMGRTSLSECRAICDAKSDCWGFELWWDTNLDCATDLGECWIYEACTGTVPFIKRKSCNHIELRAAVVTPTWKVSCGEDSSNCCTADDTCFRTMGYPVAYENNAFCLASFPAGGILTAAGKTEGAEDMITLYTSDSETPFSGSFAAFSGSFAVSPAQHFTFVSDTTGTASGVEICIVSPPSSPPSSAPSDPPSRAPSGPSSPPSSVPSSPPTVLSPIVSPSQQPTASPSVSPMTPVTTSPSTVAPSGPPRVGRSTLLPSIPPTIPPTISPTIPP